MFVSSILRSSAFRMVSDNRRLARVLDTGSTSLVSHLKMCNEACLTKSNLDRCIVADACTGCICSNGRSDRAGLSPYRPLVCQERHFLLAVCEYPSTTLSRCCVLVNSVQSFSLTSLLVSPADNQLLWILASSMCDFAQRCGAGLR